jgi:hypothetical protein
MNNMKKFIPALLLGLSSLSLYAQSPFGEMSTTGRIDLYISKQNGSRSVINGNYEKRSDRYEEGVCVLSSKGPVAYSISPRPAYKRSTITRWKGSVWPDPNKCPLPGTSVEAELIGDYDVWYSKPGQYPDSLGRNQLRQCGGSHVNPYTGEKCLGWHTRINKTGRESIKYNVISIKIDIPDTFYVEEGGRLTISARTVYPGEGKIVWITPWGTYNEWSKTLDYKGTKGGERIIARYDVNGVTYHDTGYVSRVKKKDLPGDSKCNMVWNLPNCIDKDYHLHKEFKKDATNDFCCDSVYFEPAVITVASGKKSQWEQTVNAFCYNRKNKKSSLVHSKTVTVVNPAIKDFIFTRELNNSLAPVIESVKDIHNAIASYCPADMKDKISYSLDISEPKETDDPFGFIYSNECCGSKNSLRGNARYVVSIKLKSRIPVNYSEIYPDIFYTGIRPYTENVESDKPVDYFWFDIEMETKVTLNNVSIMILPCPSNNKCFEMRIRTTGNLRGEWKNFDGVPIVNASASLSDLISGSAQLCLSHQPLGAEITGMVQTKDLIAQLSNKYDTRTRRRLRYQDTKSNFTIQHNFGGKSFKLIPQTLLYPRP